MNAFDPNAVAIVIQGHKVGYYNAQKARRLAKVLDEGQVLDAIIVSVEPLKVVAAKPEIMRHLNGGVRLR